METILVEVLRIEIGECESPATWVEVKGGHPTRRWDGDTKIFSVPVGTIYRVCSASGMRDTQKGKWFTAAQPEVEESKHIVVVINEQHTLLYEQLTLLGDNWSTQTTPKNGLNLIDQRSLAASLIEHDRGNKIVFCSPVPFLLAKVAKEHPCVGVFHNDRREKKELPNGEVISVIAREGWEIVYV